MSLTKTILFGVIATNADGQPIRDAGIEDGATARSKSGGLPNRQCFLWPKPLDLRLEHGFDRPVRRLNGDHARPGIGDTASLADALDLRTLLREFASAQD